MNKLVTSGRRFLQKLFPFLLIFLAFNSCAYLTTTAGHYDYINEEFFSRRYEKAVQEIQKARIDNKYQEKDRVLFYLDLGTALHYAGRYGESNKYLSEAEEAIEENFTKDISKLATSMLLNDNALDYPGEDYEDIFTNILKALNYIYLINLEDAMVEVRRINMKLRKLQNKYQEMAEELSKNEKKVKFKPGKTELRYSALGSSLSMLSYFHLGKLDDARIDRRRVQEATSGSLESFLDKALIPPEPERAPIYSICFTGKSPIKIPLILSLDFDPDLDLAMITIPGEENDNIIFKYKGSREFHLKFAVPIMKERHSRIRSVRLFVDGNLKGEMPLLEDFSDVAKETFKAKKPIIYLKAGLRTLLKAIIDSKAKEEIDKKTKENVSLGAILKFAVDKATDLTENADLRCWRTMPGNAYIKRTDLTPGTHDITFEYIDDRGKVVDREIKKNVIVRKKELNIIEGVSYQ